MMRDRKYSGLPDLDPAPDIYETPELVDDTSSIPATSALRSESPDFPESEALTSAVNGIDRHPINQDQARTHFLPISEQSLTGSSHADGQRRAQRDSKHRSARQDIINGVEDSSDDEKESLEQRIARLRREIAEVQSELESQAQREPSPSDAVTTETSSSIGKLSTVLANIEPSTHSRPRTTAASRLKNNLENDSARHEIPSKAQQASIDNTETPSTIEARADNTMKGDADAFTHIAEFDKRLNLLESAVGLESLPMPNQDNGVMQAIMPALDVLGKQLSTLTSTSETSIDRIRTTVRDLTTEVDTLERKRAEAREAREATHSPILRSEAVVSQTGNVVASYEDDPEHISKINALYGTLATIESLAPTLPSVLDRLRSLRSIHANAATASESLASLEKNQADMKEELDSWRAGLEKVDQAMTQGETAMKDNAETIESWVRELETRMKNL